ncbi:UNVERIFIED_CONTAM: Serine/threonine-protein kinase/endoribonuclease IRE1b [Sesamum latifolium]|uniref:non-specific serine/threonine protein kinase n=1 Tax=Sesamum latifolium TaxID=2727402 RepID=A0AAW2WFC0_9LAMI
MNRKPNKEKKEKTYNYTVVFGAPSSSNSADPDPGPENPPLSLTRKHDTAIVAAPDGTVYLVEIGSGKVLWSFSSGPSIYSSYQQVPNHEGEKLNASADGDNFYIDCGEDWELYMHGTGLTKVKLPLTAEEFVKRTPFVSAGGGVMLGSKKTAVFLVDAKTGKVVQTFRSDNLQSVGEQGDAENSSLTRTDIEEWLPPTPMDTEAVEKPLYVTRTDYALKYTNVKTGKVLCSLEPLLIANGLQDALPGSQFLSLPASDQHAVALLDNLLSPLNSDGKEIILALPASDHEESTISSLPGNAAPQISSHVESDSLVKPYYWLSVLCSALVPITMAFIFCVRGAVARRQVKSYKHSEDTKLQNITPKRRKEGRKIGKLIVTNKEIAKGSNGTIVLEGNYDGRSVAVKRLVRTHHNVAVKEIQNLIASDQHPNIVRWYGVEYDQDFVYLCLERCTCSLHELISFCTSQNLIRTRDHDHESPTLIHFNMQLQTTLGSKKELELWKVNGYPSALLLKLMRDVVRGLAHLHELGIIHRDLKPQNVLVITDRSISAKISDMGISKHLDGEMSSITKHATGSGSSGWQAPEQLRNERQTRAVDLFSLGCLLFFCMTGGKHPFGESLERDVNIVNDRKDLFLIDNIPEATHLVSRLLDPNPDLRPKAIEVMHHPLFWDSEMRLSFLRDASDRVELEDRENGSQLLEALK